METLNRGNYIPTDVAATKRREFLKKSIIFGAFTGVSGISILTGCKQKAEEGISPAEDLMREHGVLSRIMLIYDTCKKHLNAKESFSLEVLNSSALIIRNFIEQYHEKLEENYLFPKFEKTGNLKDLVEVLLVQHQAGRNLTDQIIELTKTHDLQNQEDSAKLIQLLESFNTMYRPHKAREDTILFPALRSVFSEKEFSDLGENFEDKEHEMFGKEGFEGVVVKVGDLEKELGIYDLTEFTPHQS